MHRDCPPQHVVDYAKIARMERDIWGVTFHHEDRHCRCDSCAKRAIDRDLELQAQTARAIGWSHDDLIRFQQHFLDEERTLSDPPGSVTS